MFDSFLIDYGLKELAYDTKETGGPLLGVNCMPAFLKTGHTLGSFHRLGKDFSFKQRLNNFDRIGDSSGLMFLKTTTGILSEPEAFYGQGL